MKVNIKYDEKDLQDLVEKDLVERGFKKLSDAVIHVTPGTSSLDPRENGSPTCSVSCDVESEQRRGPIQVHEWSIDNVSKESTGLLVLAIETEDEIVTVKMTREQTDRAAELLLASCSTEDESTDLPVRSCECCDRKLTEDDKYLIDDDLVCVCQDCLSKDDQYSIDWLNEELKKNIESKQAVDAFGRPCELKERDLVSLRSGIESTDLRHTHAIVFSVDPLILAAKDGSIIWDNREPSSLKVHSTCKDKDWKTIRDAMERKAPLLKRIRQIKEEGKNDRFNFFVCPQCGTFNRKEGFFGSWVECDSCKAQTLIKDEEGVEDVEQETD